MFEYKIVVNIPDNPRSCYGCDLDVYRVGHNVYSQCIQALSAVNGDRGCKGIIYVRIQASPKELLRSGT